MEVTLRNEFCELTMDEMQFVDGGAGVLAAVGAGALKVGATVGATVGLGPVGGLVLIGGCVIAAGVGIYGALNSQPVE